jgi:16S rRNA (cytosine1402-N4)-methyltransferase
MGEYHIPVLLNESVAGLALKSGGVYVDVTFGGGGHSSKILEMLEGGKLIAFDQDEDAIRNVIDDSRLIFVRHNFKYLKSFLRYYGVEKVDGIIADLGVSSHEFDEAGRGFSFRFKGALDMRMNQSAGLDAEIVVNEYSEERLGHVFRQYGEVKNWRKLAGVIGRARENKRIKTIEGFLEVIGPCMPFRLENKYMAKVFQALRIEVNNEMGVLREFLEGLADVLKPGGRVVVITYHSLEDRMVKNFFRSGNERGVVEKDFYGNSIVPLRIINRKVIVPGVDELERNPRARSAKLRIAEKI